MEKRSIVFRLLCRYTYILMGLNHTLKHRSPQENKEEERAQTLALAMTLLHRYRKVGVDCSYSIDDGSICELLSPDD